MAESQDRSSSGPEVSRRGFLVTVAGSIVGRYLLPGWQTEAAAEVPDAEAPVRKLMFPPIGNPNRSPMMLVWTEQLDNGSTSRRIWTPETPEEEAEARRFYEDACKPKGRRAGTVKGRAGPRSPEEQALLDAFLDDPTDAHRLAYARWWAAQGSTQGEFARLWQEQELLPKEDPRFGQLAEQMFALSEKHGAAWLQPLIDLGLNLELLGEVDVWMTLAPTGFLEVVTIYEKGIFPEKAQAVFAHAPLLHRLEFQANVVNVRALASSAAMGRLRALTLWQVGVTPADLRALATLPYLGRLRELRISGDRIGPEAGTALAGSPLLGRLRHLEIVNGQLGPQGVSALVSRPGPATLTTLDLSGNELDDSALRFLAGSPLLAALTTLNFYGNIFTHGGMSALCSATFLGTLEKLDLSICMLQPEAVVALAKVPFARLQALDLGDNTIGPEGARALAEAPALASLRELHLSGNGLDAGAVRTLAASPHLAGLTQLDLYANEMGAEGIKALVASPHLKQLRVLNLSSCKLDMAAVKLLAEAPSLAGLTELQLETNPIGPGGATLLARSPHLRKLSRLSVSESAVGPSGAAALKRAFTDDVLYLSDN